MNCYVRASVLTGCLISTAACGNGSGSATAPSPSFSSTAASTEARAEGMSPRVEVCHRAGDKFVAISVAQPAVGAHLAHGDGLIGQSVPGTTATRSICIRA